MSSEVQNVRRVQQVQASGPSLSLYAALLIFGPFSLLQIGVVYLLSTTSLKVFSMATDNLRKLRNCALCIICGNPREAEIIAKEMEAIEEINGSSVYGVNKNHTFYIGTLHLNENKKLNYYITSSLRQGLMHFATHAGILFQLLRPRFAIHAGCCAGNKAAGVQ